MQKAFIEHEGYKVHYVLIGTGSKYLFAFHGYGQNGEIYQAFEHSLGKKYTIISFDLFHHGNSHYPIGINPDTALTPTFFKAIMEKIANGLGINTFGLMGYSMGGRLCLCLTPLFGSRVNELFLFAPDGIKRSNGYAFGTYTLVGKALFKFMVTAGGAMVTMLKLGNLLGIVNKKAHSFFVTQVNTKQKREKLYNTWQSYRLFKPDISAVAAQIKLNNTPLHLFTGKYDKVLPPWTVNRLLKQLGNGYTNILLDSGHDLISAKTAGYLENYL